MARTRLPLEAFGFYLGLGNARTYAAVAQRFGVAERTVSRRASKENWSAQIGEHERKAKVAAEKKAEESLEAMQRRHLNLAKAIQARGVEALRSMPLRTAKEAIYAITVGTKAEQEIRGLPREVSSEVQRLEEIRRITRQMMETGVFDGAVSVEMDLELTPLRDEKD